MCVRDLLTLGTRKQERTFVLVQIRDPFSGLSQPRVQDWEAYLKCVVDDPPRIMAVTKEVIICD